MGRYPTFMRLRRLLRELRVRSHASVHVLVFAGGMCPCELGRSYRISAEENQVHTGYRRLRIIEERKDDEKHIDSKVKYLAGPSPSHVIPTPVFPPDSSDDDFEVCACIPCLHVHSPTDHCAGRRPLKGGGSKRLQHLAHQSRRGHGIPAHPRLPPSHPGTRLPRVSPLQVHRNIVLLVVAAQALSRSLESRRRSRSMTLPPFSKLLMIHAMHHAQGCKRASKEKSRSQRASQRRGGLGA